MFTYIIYCTVCVYVAFRADSSSSDDYAYPVQENDEIVCCDGSQVYTLRGSFHILCLILNIILPGWGTILSSNACVHAVRDEERGKCNWGTFVDGMIQFYTAPLIFGWFWSILFGVAIYRKTRDFKIICNNAINAAAANPAYKITRQ